MSRHCFMLALLVTLSGCRDLDRFDTGEDQAYCGEIIAAPFTRAGFARRLRLELQLDLSQMQSVPGRITSDDADSGPCQPRALFEQASLRFPQKLDADALSTLQFGPSREYNFLSWVDSSCLGTYLAVVSLMHDGDVEVRLMKGDLEAESRRSAAEPLAPEANDAGAAPDSAPRAEDDGAYITNGDRSAPARSEAFGVFPLRRYASRCAW